MKIIKPIEFKQPSSGWCSVYNIANIFNDNKALHFIEKEDYKGCTTKHEEEIIDYLGHKIYLTSIITGNPDLDTIPLDYVYNGVIKGFINLQKKYSESHPEEYLPFTPLLLSVKLTDKTILWHRVSILIYKDRLLYIDSMKEHILEIENLSDFYTLFVGCCSVETLAIKEEEQLKYGILFGDYLKHDWLKDI